MTAVPTAPPARHPALLAALALVADARRLRDGLPPYDRLAPAERREQLAALSADPDAPAGGLFAAIAATLRDDELIDLAACDAGGTTLPGAGEWTEAAAAELERRLFAHAAA